MLVGSTSYSSPVLSGRLGASLNIRRADTGQDTAAITPGASVQDLADLTVKLRRAIDSLRDVTGLRRQGSAARPASAQSSHAITISTASSAATLASTEQVNTIATSFTPRGPTFSGGSSSEVTIGGVYDGSQGDDTLTFEATVGGIVGLSLIRIDVLDGQNQVIETVDFNLGYSAGDEKTLANGLTLSLGSGTVGGSDSFEVDVSTSVGSSVDPSNPFNGTRNQNPNFEPSLAVTAGTLTVNGVQINVAADDSIDSVLANITASNAGVIATFDEVTERITFTQKTLGSAPTVTLGTDTSGFFAATKLASATVQPGEDDERTLAIANVTALAGISSGSFSINGSSFTVDVLTDSLNDILVTINESAANASAGFDPASGKFHVTATNGSSLTLGDGTSGLFSALGVTPGQFEASAGSERRVRFRRPDRLDDELVAVGRQLNEVFRTRFSSLAAPAVSLAHSVLRSSLAAGFDVEAEANSFRSFGLAFRFTNPHQGVFETDLARLRKAIERDPEGLSALLSGDGDDDGILDLLDAALDDIAEGIQPYLQDPAGLRIDTRA